jgi:non-ribosomal peptide synthetase component F
MTGTIDRLKDLSPVQRKALAAMLARKGIDVHARLPIPRIGRDEPPALSHAQQRLWFLWLMEPESPAYNVPGAIRVRGPLDTSLLERTLRLLVRRHEALRTTFAEVGDRAVQVIHADLPPDIRHLDLRALPPAEREARGRASAVEEALAPFDLRGGPLLRVRLLRMAGDEHLLLITLHHIVADGWSVDIFLKEFAAIYDALREGAEPSLPALPIQYADYAAWQRGWLEAGERDRQLAYWRDRLGEEHPLLALPLDHPRPAVLGAAGGSVAFHLGAARSRGLKSLAQARGVTPFVLLLAAFKLLLMRYSGQSDLRVGVPVANRGRMETEGVVGFFVNTLVLRSRLDGRQRFGELLEEVKSASLAAQAHQDLPFETLVEVLQPERSLSHNPLFQVKFNYGFDTSVLPSPAGLRMTQEPGEFLGAHFDLALDVADSPEGLHGSMTYARDLFEPDSIRAMADAYQALLDDILRRPDAALWQLGPAVPPACLEGERIPPAWGVLAAWDDRLAGDPEGCALRDERGAYSAAELEAAANRLAQALRMRGVGRGGRVLLCLERSCLWVVGLLGVLKAGAAYVPVEPGLPAERLRRIAERSGARCVLSAGVSLAAAGSAGVEVIDLEDPALSALPDAPPPGRPGAADGAYLIYTSGSTGEPKGVLVGHGALDNYVRGLLARLSPAPGAGMAMVSTVGADLGHTVLFGALCGGVTLHLPGDECVRDPDRFAAYMARHEVGVLKIVPSHLRGLMQAARPGDVLPARLLVLGGEACDWELVERVRALRPGCRIVNHYGPTETTVGVLTFEAGERLADGPTVPLGRPLPNARVRVLGPDLEPVPVNAAGELYIGGGGGGRRRFP